MTPETALVLVKVVHTVVWALLVLCILAVPVTTLSGRLRLALVFTAIILFEAAVLAANHMRCPLTNVAARYTDDRGDAFDIYLPAWLARNNKQVFGTVFVLGELVLVWRWLRPAAFSRPSSAPAPSARRPRASPPTRR